MPALNAANARIFRITHIDNVPWILDHGLHCQNAVEKDPDFVGIGMKNLIDKRQKHPVLIDPFGTLGDYVPFYFTPYSIMMLNIKTGYNDVIKRANKEIIVLVSSIHRLVELDVPFVFTNGHAYLAETEYFNTVGDLKCVDWALLQSRNFKRDPDVPGKQAKYQAEALIYRQMPVDALMGIACYNDEGKNAIEKLLGKRGLDLRVRVLPNWFF